jgi:hypothetical protein
MYAAATRPLWPEPMATTSYASDIETPFGKLEDSIATASGKAGDNSIYLLSLLFVTRKHRRNGGRASIAKNSGESRYVRCRKTE